MKKFAIALSTIAMLTSAGASFAGGLNETVPEEEPKAGPTSSFNAMWLIAPLVACAVACGKNGSTAGTTTTD